MNNFSNNTNVNQTTANPLNVSDRGLIQKQNEVMKMQDSILNEIERGVGRLHNQVNKKKL
jgi:hypothetical protein